MYDFKTTGSGCFQINDWVLPKDQFLFQFREDEMAIRLGYKYEWINFVKYDQFSNNGVPFASLDELKTFVADNCFKKKLVDSNFKGVATTGTEPLMEGGATYRILTAGIYTNFKDSEGNSIEVTADDLSTGFVYLIGTDGVYDKDINATREYVDDLFANALKASDINNVTVLAKNNNGTIFGLGYSSNNLATTAVIRDANGCTNVSNPTVNTHAANKQYVDSATKSKDELLSITPLTAPQTPEGVLLNQLLAALKA